ncbi:T9SS type B sorting domain-containing protein [Formosa sediminum]|uniref:T9SS type B sorting domain-containing protein n=1 Tax=Formosa sediminum TaxID=2594004 RepID=A0A516GQZ0_9FLAO|nr:T9SS type B sorting domain-containing protein [Formosa sediminum]QDO93947.1 T9SS type B sorting domain-containing protein [Formosa sediminum]
MKYTLTVLTILLHGFLFAQYEAANWYFGENAGIHFNSNTGEVTALLDGRIDTYEGSSSISDENGNLLFYTDGTTVYNKNHQIMESGLFGNSSSTQSAIVVPFPGDENNHLFYIFTVDTIESSGDTSQGFNYSIVDMTKNGGLGSVISKNKNLLAYSSEKLSAIVKDCETQSIWVITLSTASGQNDNLAFNTFYAYSITADSINTVPVKSIISSTITERRGALKFSPDGTKLVSANVGDGLFLYDFNTETGVVSGQKQILIQGTTGNRSYGAEFSPNNKYLYIHASNDYNGLDSYDSTKHTSALLQYDLDADDISNSQVILDNRNLFRGALQLGPDGRIYRALASTYDTGLPYLGVIENPNAAGTNASYKHNAIDLGGNNSTQGLPPFIQSFFNQKIDIIHASDGIETSILPLCTGKTYTLQADEITNADYYWTFNGEKLENQSEPWKMEANQEGLYKVLITPDSATVCELLEGEAYVTYYDIPVANPANNITDICDFNNDDTETINLTINDNAILGNQSNEEYQVVYFETLADAESDTNAIVAPSNYQNLFQTQDIYARVENLNHTSCYDITTFSIQLIDTPTLETQDLSQCDTTLPYNDGLTVFNLNTAIVSSDADITFYETNPETTAASPITSSNSYVSTTSNQIIYARATYNKTGCYTDQTFTLTAQDAPVLTETAYYCTGTEVTLNSGTLNSEIDNYTYQWFIDDTAILGATQYEYTTSPVGNYEVAITEKATKCVTLKTFNLEESGPATITSIEVNDLRDINTVTVKANGLGNYEYALFKDGIAYTAYQSSNYFTNVYPGHYIVKVKDTKNNCGITEGHVDVLGFPKFFTPNGDGYHDTWKIDNESQTLVLRSTILIFNRYGKLVKELRTTDEGWDGTLNGRPLPSDDYWFTLTLNDGRTFKSHFSLKR